MAIVKTTASKEVEIDAKDSFMNRFLGAIERAGNILPHPATLFVILAVLVIILSAVTAWMGIVWYLLGLPLGPSAGIYYTPATPSP